MQVARFLLTTCWHGLQATLHVQSLSRGRPDVSAEATYCLVRCAVPDELSVCQAHDSGEDYEPAGWPSLRIKSLSTREPSLQESRPDSVDCTSATAIAER